MSNEHNLPVAARLRLACDKLRVSPMPPSALIPLLLAALTIAFTL